jgi:hypothetical protein
MTDLTDEQMHAAMDWAVREAARPFAAHCGNGDGAPSLPTAAGSKDPDLSDSSPRVAGVAPLRPPVAAGVT